MKKIVFNDEARNHLREGIDIVANAVKVTLGPSGRNVTISEAHGGDPIVTKDGVTVAESIVIEKADTNVGVEMIKKVARKTVEDAGDGTTTATVLAQAIINRGLDLVDSGSNPMDLKRGMDKAVAEVVKKIKLIAKKIDGDAEKIRNVATISANNDSEIGDLIATAFEKIGEGGVIDIEDSVTADTTIRVVEGAQIDKGYLSKFFVTDSEKMEAVLEDAYVIVTDYDITLSKEIIPILEKAIPSGKPIFLVCGDLTQEGLSFITMNKLQGGLKICAIKPPAAYRSETLADIATLTGATVISDSIGIKIENADLKHLGKCGKIISTETTTTFIDGKGTQASLEVRKTEIKALIAGAKIQFDIERLKKRLARISGGVAIMSVGASTDVEMNEKKDRVDDAVRATRSAIEEGIVIGGGTCLLSCQASIADGVYLNKDEIIGSQIIYEVMEVPLAQILDNCGAAEKARTIIDQIKSGQAIGYNAKSMAFEDLFASGVIDPAKVVRVALENACSVAGMVITSECLIIEQHKKAHGI